MKRTRKGCGQGWSWAAAPGVQPTICQGREAPIPCSASPHLLGEMKAQPQNTGFSFGNQGEEIRFLQLRLEPRMPLPQSLPHTPLRGDNGHNSPRISCMSSQVHQTEVHGEGVLTCFINSHTFLLSLMSSPREVQSRNQSHLNGTVAHSECLLPQII